MEMQLSQQWAEEEVVMLEEEECRGISFNIQLVVSEQLCAENVWTKSRDQDMKEQGQDCLTNHNDVNIVSQVSEKNTEGLPALHVPINL